MPDRNVSDRERLLKLIDGDSATVQDVRRSRQWQGFRQKLFFWASFGKLSSAHLWRFNAFLIVLLLGVVAAIGWDLYQGAVPNAPKADLTVDADDVDGLTDGTERQVTSREDYVAAVKGKDIFNPERIKAEAPAEEPGQVSSADLKLVGVDWSENPVAMIEDARAHKTFFVKSGDALREFKVGEIFRDRVILRYGDRSVEIK